MGTTAEKLAKIKKSKEDIKAALVAKKREPSDVLSTYANEIKGLDVIEFDEMHDEWTLELPDRSSILTTDKNGDTYVAVGSQVQKITSRGVKSWDYDIGENDYIFRAITDNEDNVYCLSNGSSFCKISVAGALIWTYKSDTFAAYGAATDSNANVYLCDANSTVKKYDATGNEILTLNTPHPDPRAIKCGFKDDLYCFMSYYVSKFDSTGAKIWTTEAGEQTTSCDIDSFDNVYFGGSYVENIPGVVVKLDSNGKQIWRTDTPYIDQYSHDIDQLAVDDSGAVYYGYSYISLLDSFGHPVPGFRLGAGANYPKLSFSLFGGSLIYWSKGIVHKCRIPSMAKLYKNPKLGYNSRPMEIDGIMETNDTPVFRSGNRRYGGYVSAMTMGSDDTLYLGLSYYNSVYAVDPYGNDIWSGGNGVDGKIQGVATNTRGNVCSVGYDGIIRYYGRIEGGGWQMRVDGNEHCIALGDDRKAYVSFTNQLDQYLGNGEQLWTYRASSSFGKVGFLTLDGANNSYLGTGYAVDKITQFGAKVWDNNVGAQLHDGAIDSRGNLYFGVDDKTIHKIDSNGREIWKLTDDAIYTIKMTTDRLGYVYCTDGHNTVRKISREGAEIWRFTAHSSQIYSLAVDSVGQVYFGCEDCTVSKLKQVYKIY